MTRQHCDPYLINDGSSRVLEPVEGVFKEKWLQKFIFENPQSLPVNEVEPVFSPLIPICRELPTDAGPVDVLFINQDGLLTLVECKLWDNPEARRTVIGQILDYGKEISRWGYEDLERAIQKTTREKNASLFKLISENSEEMDEKEFVDNVTRNLKRGRFLLLIVGEGIRESTELIADFLQNHAHLNFSFALVELAIFQLPEEYHEGYIVHPRVIAETTEIERAVIRIEDGQVIAEAPKAVSHVTGAGRRGKISEQAFYEALGQVDPRVANELKQFFVKANQYGPELKAGAHSLMLKFVAGDEEFNLGVFNSDGSFQNFGIASRTMNVGHPEIGEEYLDGLASILKNAKVDRHPPDHRFTWSVKRIDGKSVAIADCLAVQDEWLNLIQKTTDRLAKIQEQRD